jgi:hypothetical protein
MEAIPGGNIDRNAVYRRILYVAKAFIFIKIEERFGAVY